MKTTLSFLACIVAAIATVAAPPPNPQPQPPETRNPKPETSNSQTLKPSNSQTVSSWSLYYGNYRADMVDKLVADLVVVDPAALGAKADEVIAALKAKGCRVAGYLSCIEVAKWHRYKNEVPEEWRIRVDGKDWVPWGENKAISLAVPEWRAKLVELMRSEVFAHGCDGVFMDTLADIDNPSLPEEERLRQLDGLGKFAAAFDEAYPDKLFIANWTIQRSLPPLAPHIDFLCWEDFSPKHFANPGTRAWMEGIAKRIEAERAKHQFKVLTLWTAGDSAPELREEMERISKEHGFLPYCASGDYRTLK